MIIKELKELLKDASDDLQVMLEVENELYRIDSITITSNLVYICERSWDEE